MHWIFRAPLFPASRWNEMRRVFLIILDHFITSSTPLDRYDWDFNICKNWRTQSWNESPFFMTEAANQVPNQKWYFQSSNCIVYFWNYLIHPFFWNHLRDYSTLELMCICIKNMKASASLMEKSCHFLTGLCNSTIKMKTMRFMCLTKPEPRQVLFLDPCQKEVTLHSRTSVQSHYQRQKLWGIFQTERESRV